VKNGSGSTPGEIQKSAGIGDRLRGVIDTTLGSLIDIAGNPNYQADQSSYGKRITDLGKKIVEENSKLQAYEDKYWKQFAAMEAAINKMNAQQAWLSQQFSY
jgi:flagellar hook-associated protein 2